MSYRVSSRTAETPTRPLAVAASSVIFDRKRLASAFDKSDWLGLCVDAGFPEHAPRKRSKTKEPTRPVLAIKLRTGNESAVAVVVLLESIASMAAKILILKDNENVDHHSPHSLHISCVVEF